MSGLERSQNWYHFLVGVWSIRRNNAIVGLFDLLRLVKGGEL
jgi:hypothetical protein